MSKTGSEAAMPGPPGAAEKVERKRKMDEEGETHPEGSSEGLPDKELHPDQTQGPNEPLGSTSKGG